MENEMSNNDDNPTISNQELNIPQTDNNSNVDGTINTDIVSSTPSPQEQSEPNNMSIDENSSLIDQSMESQDGIGRCINKNRVTTLSLNLKFRVTHI